MIFTGTTPIMNLQIHLQQWVMLTTPGLVSPAEAGIMLLWLSQPKFKCAKLPQCGLAGTESGHSLSYGLDGLWGKPNIHLPFGAWKMECIPVEKLIHLPEKGGLPVPSSPLTEKQAKERCLSPDLHRKHC